MTELKLLPETLKLLIHDTLAILDEVIKEQAGSGFYREMDSLRKQMAGDTKVSSEQWQKTLLATYENTLQKYSQDTKRTLAHSFTLMIALVNACETAYRTYRLHQKHAFSQIPKSRSTLVFVLTAHPTEARAPAHILLFQQIRSCCLTWLDDPKSPSAREHLKHLLKLAWLTPVARHRRPTVLDEADAIFSSILRHDILDELILMRRAGIDIRIRTWVGGDKDGHPDVDETVMLKVMGCARERFVKVVNTRLQLVRVDLAKTELSLNKLNEQLKQSQDKLKKLETLGAQDQLQLTHFKQSFTRLLQKYEKTIGALHPELSKIKILLQIFPALLIPLELREDAKEVHGALKADKPFPITRMLDTVSQLSQKAKVEYYAKGLILSMTKNVKDIKAGLQLVKQVLPNKNFRIVPLFETEEALQQAAPIIAQIFKQKRLLKHIQTKWDNKFEIMLGYSDSSKGMGVLASRLTIANTMRALDELCKSYRVTPIFFHGSGGSIDRGGGSIEEQTAWWPHSSFLINKTTLQGEMVERSFASRAIMKSMVGKLLLESEKAHAKVLSKNTVVTQFAQKVSAYYQQELQDPLFLDVVSKATSYRVLDKLRFGSRPVNRQVTSLSVDALRAIPWVLCWMQTRILFPTWWGVGSAWAELRPETKKALKAAYSQNPLFSAFMKLLGFTLAKVDLPIWHTYLATSDLDQATKAQVKNRFDQEYERACEAHREITGESNLLWFRPWLQESIALRSPLIHPLNLLQIHAIKENDAYLFRETTSGIAAGMLTTG